MIMGCIYRLYLWVAITSCIYGLQSRAVFMGCIHGLHLRPALPAGRVSLTDKLIPCAGKLLPVPVLHLFQGRAVRQVEFPGAGVEYVSGLRGLERLGTGGILCAGNIPGDLGPVAGGRDGAVFIRAQYLASGTKDADRKRHV